jgi:hypothetical protein
MIFTKVIATAGFRAIAFVIEPLKTVYQYQFFLGVRTSPIADQNTVGLILNSKDICMEKT